MKEYIEREALLKTVRSMDGLGGMAVLDREKVERCIKDFPAADVVERKRGVWIFDRDMEYHQKCSECGGMKPPYYIAINFCPNCGVDMRREQP